MTLEQRARKLVKTIHGPTSGAHYREVLAALRAVRDEALEETARIVERNDMSARSCAEHIRALKYAPPNPIDDAEFGTAEWRRDHPEPPREPDNGTGFLEVTANASEVIVNLPRDMIGHIKFTPAQAALLANSLIAKAHIAIVLAKAGTIP